MAWPSKELLNGRSVCPKPTRIEATPPGRRGAGGPSLRLRPPAQTYFAALRRAVVCQRRVGGAAEVIDGRLIAALGGVLGPRRLLSLPAGGSVLPTCPSI
jgi:hypothetical protein